MSGLPPGRPVAVLVARGGQLPYGADEAAAEAGGMAVVLGSGAQDAADALTAAAATWWCETGPGLQPGALSAALAPVLARCPLVVLPASPDGRDLAPRLAAALGRPLLAQAVRVEHVADGGGPCARADLVRLDGRVLVEVETEGPAVATLVPGVRSAALAGERSRPQRLELPAAATPTADPEVLEVIEPDPATMDLSDAARVLGGGAGLVPRGSSPARGRAVFEVLSGVAAALRASAGATRVATDAGWIPYDRQIGTTGVAVDPELYVAFGVSGAIQHTGGLGAPRLIVSINTDASSPMTAMASLGIVADANAVLLELARRLDVPIPAEAQHA